MSEITKEQALEALLKARVCVEDGWEEELTMAIRYIEQQPVEREAWAWECGRHELLSFDQPDAEQWRQNIRKVMVREL